MWPISCKGLNQPLAGFLDNFFLTLPADLIILKHPLVRVGHFESYPRVNLNRNTGSISIGTVGQLRRIKHNPESNTNKKNILKTALSILEAIANNPQLMKNYKTEDMTITGFSENLQNRIDALDRKIRLIANDDNVYEQGASFAYLFKE